MTGGPRILVVDDEPDSLLIARLALAEAGYETVLAADADRACHWLGGGGVDLVCLDAALVLGDGPLVLQAAADVSVPVLVVSAGPAPAGAAGYLPKPFTALDLVEAVGATLEDWSFLRSGVRHDLEEVRGRLSRGGRPHRPGPRE